MRLPTYDTPRIISCSDIQDDYLVIPCGCEDDIIEVFRQYNVNYIIEDKTNHGRQISVAFKGILREEQEKAIRCMFSYDVGTLSATTAFGKTIFAIAMIAKR